MQASVGRVAYQGLRQCSAQVFQRVMAAGLAYTGLDKRIEVEWVFGRTRDAMCSFAWAGTQLRIAQGLLCDGAQGWFVGIGRHGLGNPPAVALRQSLRQREAVVPVPVARENFIATGRFLKQ